MLFAALLLGSIYFHEYALVRGPSLTCQHSLVYQLGPTFPLE